MNKPFWKSKTIWASVITFIAGGLTATGHASMAQAILAFGVALGLTGLRTAMKS